MSPLDYFTWIAQETQPERTPELALHFLHKIADGKLLLRFSHMTCNVTCDCCKAEEHIAYSPDFPDTLNHKSWCIVTAARYLCPDAVIHPYPERLRLWGNDRCDEPQFSWLETKGES